MPSQLGRWSPLGGLLVLACVLPGTSVTAPRAPGALLGVVDTILPVAKGRPYGAAASTRGQAYVTVHGAWNGLASWDFGRRRFDANAISTGRAPTNVAFDPAGRHAYVASQRSFRVERVDVDRARVDEGWHTPANDPYQVAISADGQKAIATGNAGWLYLFDAHSGRPRGAIEVRNAPNGIALTKDGRTAYITHLRSREVGMVDLTRGTYRTFAQLDSLEGQGIALSPDGATLYTVSERADRLYAFDTRTGRTLWVRSTGRKPFGLAITPDGAELWVTTLEGELLRYRRDDLTLVAANHLGGRLRRLAFDPAGRGAVVADEEGRVLVLK